jgi:transglutaminase-like putative cysteine protease
MLIDCGFDLVFDVPAPTPMVLALYLHPSRNTDLVEPPGIETLRITPFTPAYDYYDTFGNRLSRILAPAGELAISHRITVRDSGLPDEPVRDDWLQHPVQDLPAEVLQFLLASRYCEVDRFMDLAWKRFGHLPPGGVRVRAVLDFVHSHLKFSYASARPTKTAWDAYEERLGVCRDFQHLAITFCRCLNIPARYVSGYLGDIGVPPDPAPMDFSAWMEVYLSGAWRTLDARHNKPRIGRVLMTTGRDAVDVALTTGFGTTTLKRFFVVTAERQAG